MLIGGLMSSCLDVTVEILLASVLAIDDILLHGGLLQTANPYATLIYTFFWRTVTPGLAVAMLQHRSIPAARAHRLTHHSGTWLPTDTCSET